MIPAPAPLDEDCRLQALRSLHVLDSAPEPEFDALAAAAAAVCGTPISLISLVDAERQWIKANVGLAGVREIPRRDSYCAHAILEDAILEINDAATDPRFREAPGFPGFPGFRFYAGAPLRLSDGQRVGTLCVADHAPRRLERHQREILHWLAIAASRSLESRRRLLDEHRALEESHARIQLAAESGGIGVWELDLATGLLAWDAGMFRQHDLAPGTPIDRERWMRHVVDDDRAGAMSALQDAIARHDALETEFRIARADGGIRNLRIMARVVRDDPGDAGRLIGISQDFTLLRSLTAELASQHELLRVTLHSIGDGVITTDAAGRVTWLNPVAERMTGWPCAEATGRPLRQVFHVLHEDTREAAQDPVAECLQRQAVAGLATSSVLVARGGEEHGIEDSAAPIRSDAGAILGAVLVFHDVTEQRRLSGEMSYRATHDALTGLVNRAEFESRLRRLLHRAQEDRTVHALMYIDLDQFKLVNDACGHSAGDDVLKRVSTLLTGTVRSRDTLARLGGDEFAVIMEHCTVEQAQRVASQVCERMEDFRFVHDGRGFRIGTSIGLVPVDGRWTGMAAILQAADSACYAAKEAGRNRVHTWYDSDRSTRRQGGEAQWSARIERALAEDRLCLHAQRIAPIRGAVDGLHAELLVRLVEPDGRLVLPAAFLPSAERFHLASRIDRWVLQQAITWLAGAPAGPGIRLLGVNLSGQSVGDRSFHRHAAEALAQAGPQVARRLCVEFTESIAISNLDDACLLVEQLRAVGARVAIDDFGSGASSFAYLKRLPVDFLKIDGQFIRDLLDDPLDAAAVRCFAEVSRAVGVPTIAESVEQAAQLERLREYGIDYAQGSAIHAPQPIETLGTPQPA